MFYNQHGIAFLSPKLLGNLIKAPQGTLYSVDQKKQGTAYFPQQVDAITGISV